jgi:hypothetical protein
VRLQPVSLSPTGKTTGSRALGLIEGIRTVAARQDFVEVLAPVSVRRAQDLDKLRRDEITAFVITQQGSNEQLGRLATLGKPVLPGWDAEGNPSVGRDLDDKVVAAGGMALYPQGKAEVESALRALRAVAFLRGMRVLIVGPLRRFRTEFIRAAGLQWLPHEFEDLERRFGMRILAEEDINAYFAGIEAADQKEAKYWAEKWAREADIVKDRVRENLVNYARIYVAIRNLVKQHQADALCVSCDAKPTDREKVLGINVFEPASTPSHVNYINEFVPCWSASLLLDEGIPWFCKGDTRQLVSISLLMGVSGRAALMGDLYRASSTEEIERLVKENIVLQRHDIIPPSMGAEGKRVQLTDMHSRGVGCCGFVEMAAGGTVTLMDMDRWKTEWRCYTGRVVWSKLANMDPKPHDQCCVEVAYRVKSAGRVTEAQKAWGEHQVLVQGDWTRELGMLSRLYKAKIRNLDA